MPGSFGYSQLQADAPSGIGTPRDTADPEGAPLPPNTLVELRRDMARLRLVRDQIKEIETARMQRLGQAPEEGPHAMVRLLSRVVGVGVETADMLVHEILSRRLRGSKGGRPLRPASQVHPMRAAAVEERRVLLAPAMPAFDAA